MKKIFLLSNFILTLFVIGISQSCDCDIYPVKKECKEKCGLKILQIGTKNQIKDSFHVTEETAKKIVSVPNRKNKTSIKDFQEDLPFKYYKDLDSNFTGFLGTSIIHNNINAPNAQIVTQNQSGGNNTVNYFQNEYKALDESIYKSIEQNLISLIKKYPNHPIVRIEVESGNNLRNKIALKLSELLSLKKIGYYPSGNTFIGRFPDYPVSVFIKPENRDFVNEFLEAIKPFVQGEFKVIEDPGFSTDTILFYLNGEPSFDNNGRVKIN